VRWYAEKLLAVRENENVKKKKVEGEKTKKLFVSENKRETTFVAED
jgi:hypothetical protein